MPRVVSRPPNRTMFECGSCAKKDYLHDFRHMSHVEVVNGVRCPDCGKQRGTLSKLPEGCVVIDKES